MNNSESKGTEYICIECKNITILKQKDPIRCSQCGKNILYKTRDKNAVVQLQAI
ncbi:DNA-directed RNA polymerases I, II, and III subunit RPABC4 [Pancytospora epiphaga]|nr:DNA-directed RNA polymerases I, II, and III subunit RPABC4 [Pancytospora epiphaga]